MELAELGVDVAACRLQDPAGAERILAGLLRAAPDPESFERLARQILAHLAGCPDPDMALANFDRWLSQLGHGLSIQRLLTEDPFLLGHLLQVLSTSQYFADILCRDPSYYEFLTDLDALGRERTPEQVAASMARAVAPFRTYEGRLDALRRAKRREILRIGIRDIIGLAPFAEVVREISAFADAVVCEAYRMARAEVERRAGSLEGLEFAVIAMGKHGGRELNYSSDIDLMFVYRGHDRLVDSALRIGERTIQALSRPTGEGYVFRVDMRLRPEGKLGPLVRSLDSYRDYYDHHMAHWERQALLKARFVAGDDALGRDFHALIEPYVYRQEVSLQLVEELRLNKLRVEKRTEVAGERYTNVKDGYGAIRDVEFTVQLLQLLFGARHPALRTGNTLEALAALRDIGVLAGDEHDRIADAYVFFRTVEHRLQIMDERAVRCIPTDAAALDRLARRMPGGGPPSPGGAPPPGGAPREAGAWRTDPGEEFQADYHRRASLVRAFHRRLFYDPFYGESGGDSFTGVGELLLALDAEDARRRIRQYLVASGFSAPDRALEDLDRLAGSAGERVGLGAGSSLPLLARVGPALLGAAAGAPDPDAALSFAAEMAQAVRAQAREYGERDALLVTLGESDFARDVLCRLGGTAPAMAQAVRREPALLDMLFEPDVVVAPADAESLRQRLALRLGRQKEHESRLNALRRFKRREMLRIAAADVLASPEVDATADQLTLLAECCIRAALDLSIAELRSRGQLAGEPEFAVFGLGKVGGREMLYPSDLDLVFVCDLPEGEARESAYLAYFRLSELFQDAMTRLLPDGDLYPLDLRLRPEGKGGEPVPSLDACRRYYSGRAQTWERQAMLKARFLAGDARVAQAFLEIITPFAYPEAPSPELAGEVRAMKRRIERERTDPATRSRDLKLGPGGLSDVEFQVQLLQLLNGHALPALRETGTLAALAGIEGAGLLPAEECGALAAGYRFQMRLRNLLFLRRGGHTSALPDGVEDQRALARALGMDNAGELLDAFHAHRQRVRELFEARFAA